MEEAITEEAITEEAITDMEAIMVMEAITKVTDTTVVMLNHTWFVVQ
jgi:hypothetical protein